MMVAAKQMKVVALVKVSKVKQQDEDEEFQSANAAAAAATHKYGEFEMRQMDEQTFSMIVMGERFRFRSAAAAATSSAAAQHLLMMVRFCGVNGRVMLDDDGICGVNDDGGDGDDGVVDASNNGLLIGSLQSVAVAAC